MDQTLLLYFLLNIVSVLLIVFGAYYKNHNSKEFVFVYVLFNILVFFVCYILGNATVELGFAFGIFALFSILRYRTSTIPVIEMTYLFTVVAIAIINSLTAGLEDSWYPALFVNGVVVFLIVAMEYFWLAKQTASKVIIYDKIDLIHLDKRPELISDLIKRTGLPIRGVEIGKINWLNDTARIVIFYAPTKGHSSANVHLVNEASS